MTAPDESTLALLGDISHSRLVTPAAAQETASVEGEGRPIAYSASRARNAESTDDEIMTLSEMAHKSVKTQ